MTVAGAGVDGTCSENNTEAATAGLHKGPPRFALFDEASSIGDGVWETIESVLTDHP